MGGDPAANDDSDPDEPLLPEPVDHRTPERLFEQRWAISLFEQVLGRLREEFRIAGQEGFFDVFKQFLTGDPSERYAVVAARIGMTEGRPTLQLRDGASILTVN